jgi:hypothetical protein
MDARIEQTAMREHLPNALIAAELDLENEPTTESPHARSVRAWARYGGIAT